MNSPTKEQLSDLTEALNQRLEEFEIVAMPTITVGIMRQAYDVIQAWMQEHAGGSWRELDIAPPAPPAMVFRMPVVVAPVTAHEPAHTNGHHADELELSTATVVTLGAAHTGGNGHHAEPSPAAVATLGPAHTMVTPLVPRRPRTLAEVDGIDDDDGQPARLGVRAKKELDEIRAKAAAKARLGEVTREQVIAELKRQAMAGTMPTMGQFDLAKPVVWPKAQMLTLRLGMGWSDLAREAGLKLVRR